MPTTTSLSLSLFWSFVDTKKMVEKVKVTVREKLMEQHHNRLVAPMFWNRFPFRGSRPNRLVTDHAAEGINDVLLIKLYCLAWTIAGHHVSGRWTKGLRTHELLSKEAKHFLWLTLCKHWCIRQSMPTDMRVDPQLAIGCAGTFCTALTMTATNNCPFTFETF